MPARIEARLLEPFYVKGVPIVPFRVNKHGLVHLAVGKHDETGPLETEDDVLRTAKRWQQKPAKLDRSRKSGNDEGKSSETASLKAPAES